MSLFCVVKYFQTITFLAIQKVKRNIHIPGLSWRVTWQQNGKSLRNRSYYNLVTLGEDYGTYRYLLVVMQRKIYVIFHSLLVLFGDEWTLPPSVSPGNHGIPPKILLAWLRREIMICPQREGKLILILHCDSSTAFKNVAVFSTLTQHIINGKNLRTTKSSKCEWMSGP